MSNSKWYAISIAAIAASVLCFYVLENLARLLRASLETIFLQLRYRYINPNWRGLDTTWLHALLVAALWVGNASYLIVTVRSRQDLLHETAMLFTVNLIPLALGSHMNTIADLLHVGLDGYIRLHRWIGWLAVIEGLVHTAIALAEKPGVKSVPQIAAVVAASSVAGLIVFSIPMVRRLAYETFLRAHQVFVVALVVGVWLHSPGNQFQIPILYLLIASCLWVALRLLRLLTILTRNYIGKHACRAKIWTLSDAFQVHVTVTRPWKYHAGQYIYLRLRRAGYGARLQSHPYFLSWWYVDSQGRDVVVLIVGRQRGFSRGLDNHSNGGLVVGKEKDGRLVLASDAAEHGVTYKAHIEGPYGQALELDAYGTVILIATGSGIAGIFPFIKQLLAGYHRWDAKVRRLMLFWEVEREQHMLWLGNWMTEMLDVDTYKILNIKIYITEGSARSIPNDSSRIKVVSATLDVTDVLRQGTSGVMGRAAVLLCVRKRLNEQARRVVLSLTGKVDIRLHELPFHPSRVFPSLEATGVRAVEKGSSTIA
ncbi:hypothetical protein OIDMADRAFT_61439 [Oidiodendron maius Zn]|uniref:FAD-binding FR-type domain-containing protein n=1 Tax=Oidiodendron maius (strain Zn) TaxID=913774 RepID=A0A0C3GBE6_OIDMZ|nr:hypothetical protein OIDMADRAFT_61439 [Oidiodendron maius Zn]